MMACTLTLSALAAPVVTYADEYDQKIKEQDTKIKNLDGKAASAEAKLATVRANINAIQEEAAKLQEQRKTLNSEVKTLDKEISSLKTRIEKRNNTIKEQARAIQENGAKAGYLNIILSADSISDAISKTMAASKLINANNDLMKQQEKDKNAVEKKKAANEKKIAELNKNAGELDRKAGEMQKQELEATILVNQIAAQKETEKSKKAEYVKKQKEAEEQKAAQARLEKEIAAKKAAEQQTANTAAATNTATSDSSNSGASNSSSTTDNSSNNNGGTNNTPVTPTNGSGIVNDALKFLGVPYVWGGTTPAGFDCSGLVQYVFAMNGIQLKRVTTDQEWQGTMISIDQLQPGDLVFFGPRGATYHVGIYIGNGEYVHAPEPGDVVKITKIQYYTPDFGVRVG